MIIVRIAVVLLLAIALYAGDSIYVEFRELPVYVDTVYIDYVRDNFTASMYHLLKDSVDHDSCHENLLKFYIQQTKDTLQIYFFMDSTRYKVMHESD